MPATNEPLGKKIGKAIKYTVFATNIIAIVLLLLSLLAWPVAPSRMTFIACMGLIFPVTLFINVAYLILWSVFLRWKYAVIQLVVILACWQPISACFPVHLETGEKDIPENRIKILTYNVRGFNWLTGDEARKNPILEYVVQQNADIVCFQEFAVATQKKKNNIISEQELNGIMKDYPYHSIVPLGKLGKSNKSYLYGIACYSKFPITESLKIPLQSVYNGSVIHKLEIQRRTVSLVINHLESNRLTTEDKKLYRDFLKTRDRESFDEMASTLHNRLGTAYRIRESQVNLVRTFMDRQETDATIVCGDFNDTPISYAYHTMKGNLVDAYANTGFGQGITYHENYFWVRIDFILHSLAFQSYNCTVDKVKYSDHYPVWTYLAFK
jgi:endonuclease/exonuclease/phosphatase family metal-dependent hydrolase